MVSAQLIQLFNLCGAYFAIWSWKLYLQFQFQMNQKQLKELIHQDNCLEQNRQVIVFIFFAYKLY